MTAPLSLVQNVQDSSNAPLYTYLYIYLDSMCLCYMDVQDTAKTKEIFLDSETVNLSPQTLFITSIG